MTEFEETPLAEQADPPAGEAATADAVPNDVARFNWAAFILPWAWYFAHGLWRIGILFIAGPLVVGGLFAAILPAQHDGPLRLIVVWLVRDVGWVVLSAAFAWRANRLAWSHSGGLGSLDEYLARERRWEKWAVLAAIAFVAADGAFVNYVVYAMGLALRR
jgi:hypothetical protein